MIQVILAIISAIVTLGVAYIGIYPKLIERKETEHKELLSAVQEIGERLTAHEEQNNKQMKQQSDALMLMMRSNLHSRFDILKQQAKELGEPNREDIEDWWERYDAYKALNGNHSVDRLSEYMRKQGWVV